MAGRFRWKLQDEIENRRNRVRELQGSGYTITEIAQQLQISVPTIKRDSAFLHKQAKENYQRHITDRLTYDVENTLAFYSSIQKQAQEIAKTTENEGIKIKALALAKDSRKEYQDLELRGDYVKRALDVSEHIQKKLNELPSDATTSTGTEEEEELEQELETENDPQAKF